MQIIKCNDSHRDAWNAFVAAEPSATFYHRFEWREINRASFGHSSAYLAAVEGDRVVGVHPIVRLNSLLFGNIACSMPFVNYGGPAAAEPGTEQALLAASSDVADQWQVDFLEIRSQRYFGADYPSSNHKVSMTVELNPNPDVVMEGYKREQRKEIRRAQKNGFVTKFGGVELLEPFYSVLSESWRDLGTPIYQKAYLRAVMETFPADTRICAVFAADGSPAAAALCGHHRDVVEGMWAGTCDRYRKDLVGYILYWEMIRDACERGYTRFHLGRSTAQSGGEQFKKKWNATATQLYWHYVLRNRPEIPQLNVTNKKYRLAMAAWKRLPVGVSQVIGPFIARSIP
jgi:FemAB-related protein (PEP-CTERM system-associated)